MTARDALQICAELTAIIRALRNGMVATAVARLSAMRERIALAAHATETPKEG